MTCGCCEDPRDYDETSLCACSDINQHQQFCIVLCLFSGIVGITALALNDMSQCADSYQTLMVLGIGLAALSVFYLFNFKFLRLAFFPMVYFSLIFVFVLDCMLIDQMTRGDDCSKSPRLWIVLATIPLQACVCGLAKDGLNIEDEFWGIPEAPEREF